MNTITTYCAGSIDQRGVINSLDRQGFTPIKCGSEFIANSIDANSSNILFTYDMSNIKIIDDGQGMTLDKLKKMVNIFGENHAGHRSMGVSGMGFSASSYQWSKARDGKPKRVHVYTKNQNSEHYKLCIPWDKISIEGQFTGQVEITKMDENEILNFVSERNDNGFKLTGTTIAFYYAESIIEILEDQFKETSSDLDNSWSVIFGKTDQLIMYYDGEKINELRKYNYFNDLDGNFYWGKYCTEIYSFIDKQTGMPRFVCKDPYRETPEGIYMEFKKNGRGVNTTKSDVEIDFQKYNDYDIIYFVSGMRKRDEIFDERNPKPTTATYYANDYDRKFLGDKLDSNSKFYGQISIFRNNQRITGFVPSDYKLNNARGNGEIFTKLIYHRVTLSYNVESKQNNNIDNIHGIQQNKNQNQKNFPLNYQRLVTYLKEFHIEQIKQNMVELINNSKSKPQTEPEFENESDSESESELEFEFQPEPEPEAQEIVLQQEPEPQHESEHEAQEIVLQQDSEPELQVKYNTNEIEESRKWLINAAKIMMETAANIDYSGVNGNEIYNLIMTKLK